MGGNDYPLSFIGFLGSAAKGLFELGSMPEPKLWRPSSKYKEYGAQVKIRVHAAVGGSW